MPTFIFLKPHKISKKNQVEEPKIFSYKNIKFQLTFTHQKSHLSILKHKIDHPNHTLPFLDLPNIKIWQNQLQKLIKSAPNQTEAGSQRKRERKVAFPSFYASFTCIGLEKPTHSFPYLPSFIQPDFLSSKC